MTLPPQKATQVLLQDIRSGRVRNLIRGALATTDALAFKRTIESVRRECPQSDAKTMFRFLEESPLAHGFPHATAFPSNLGEIDIVQVYRGGSLDLDLTEQALRIERESASLLEAIGLIGDINRAALSQDWAAVGELFATYRERFGISLLIAHKAISFRHFSGSLLSSSSAFSDVTDPFTNPSRRIVTAAFEDSVDRERDYTRTRRTFLEFTRKDQVDRRDALVIEDVFSPLSRSGSAGERIQAFARWSLIDGLASLFRMERLLTLQGLSADAKLVRAAIPEAVYAAWTTTFVGVDPVLLQKLIGIEDQFFDRALYAHLPAWSEYPDLIDYRYRVESAIGERLDGRFPVSRRNASTFASPCHTVEELLGKGEFVVRIDKVDPKTSGAFHRTIALIASVESSTLKELNGESLRLLLDQTLDVANLLSKGELSRFLPRRYSDKLYEFLRAALINELEESKVSQHAVRRALQDLVIADFGGDIVNLLKHLDTENNHVAGHLYHLSTEAFLTELYDLFEESDQVTEAQANILEWRGATRGDEDAALRAKSHRLSLRLRKIRGAIEETRIYVDPFRFLEWVHEAKGTELRALASFAPEIVTSSDRSLSLTDQVKVAIDPRLRLLSLLNDCYHEFCTNKIYGVTSFIGRRIRHGALHGYLVLEFAPKVQAVIHDLRERAPKFAAFLSQWLLRFDAAVQQLASDRIHVNSKDRPKGLIRATIVEADKTIPTQRMLEEVAKSMLDSSALNHSMALIGEYCWLVFEVDLKRARDAVENLRREFAFQIDEHSCGEIETDRLVNDRLRALSSEFQHRFDIVASWLTRPTSISPSASVAQLFQVVLEEVENRYSDFEPQLTITGEQEIDLIGHRFGYVYDALYILVDNAARHGSREGQLIFDVQKIGEDPSFVDLKVTVTSELPESSGEQAKHNIDAAMSSAIGDAMMDTRNSGIRKLRGLVESLDELVSLERHYTDTSVSFVLEMRYART